MSKEKLSKAECKTFIIDRFNKMKKALEQHPTAYVIFCGSYIGRPEIIPEKLTVVLEKEYRTKNMTKLDFSSPKYIQENVHDVAAMRVEMRLV